LEDASLEAWESAVDLAVERRVAFVLLLGDLARGGIASLRAQVALRAGLERLRASGIGIVIVPGRGDPPALAHAPADGWPAFAAEPSGFPSGTIVVRPGEARTIPGPDGAILATIEALPTDDSCAHEAARSSETEHGLRIGVVHAAPGASRAEDVVASLANLGEGGFDWIAVGSLPEHAIHRAGEAWIVSAGTTQGRSTEAPESGPKGVVIAEVDGGRVYDAAMVPVDRARFLDVSAPIDARAGVEVVVSLLEAELERVRREHSGRALIVRGMLRSASGSSPQAAVDPQLRSEILRRLRKAYDGAFPIVWWSTIDLADTSATTTVDDESEDGPPLGDFATDFRAAVEAYGAALDHPPNPDDRPHDLDRRIASRWSKLEEVSAARRLEPLDSDATRRLLRRAEREALYLLEKEMEE